MLDQVPFVRPRVALVYGDAGAAGHVREAVAEHVQIVYSTSAAEFDAARLEDSRATAALLNLDSCDWLDAVETWLHAAGVAVIYNDPEISRALQGWEQARWLRHLTAKLSGSTDFDPPRPVPVAAPPPDVEPAAPEVVDAPAAQPHEMAMPVVHEAPAPAPAEFIEQPLSPAEIASMTANFNAVPEVPAVMQTAPTDLQLVSDDQQQFGDAVEAVVTDAAPAAPVSMPAMDAAPAAAEDDSPLDVDTEALSALIDARLAEAEGHAPADAPQVWRVADGGAVSAVDLAPKAQPDAAQASQDAPAAIVQPPADDSELMQGLPAIDDWQLVDPDATAAPEIAAGEKQVRTEPSVSIDFAGLELVPMEPPVQVDLHAEPIERWMHVDNHDAQVADKNNKQPAAPDANGDRA